MHREPNIEDLASSERLKHDFLLCAPQVKTHCAAMWAASKAPPSCGRHPKQGWPHASSIEHADSSCKHHKHHRHQASSNNWSRNEFTNILQVLGPEPVRPQTMFSGHRLFHFVSKKFSEHLKLKMSSSEEHLLNENDFDHYHCFHLCSN